MNKQEEYKHVREVIRPFEKFLTKAFATEQIKLAEDRLKYTKQTVARNRLKDKIRHWKKVLGRIGER